MQFHVLNSVNSQETNAIDIKLLLKQAGFLALPKGRYMPIIERHLEQYGIRQVAESPKKGSLYDQNGEKLIEYAYMRDAAIADFVANVRGSIGFTGSHQLFETFKGEPPISSKQLITVENARFMLASSYDKSTIVKEKIRSHDFIRIATEYPETARKIAKLFQWKCHFEPTMIGASEVMASSYPFIDAVLGITSTGQTLLENNLTLVEDHLEPVSICLVGALLRQ